ncbi:hypothetical protein HDU91_001361, partial [Kappamyces sp. JEL0680]
TKVDSLLSTSAAATKPLVKPVQLQTRPTPPKWNSVAEIFVHSLKGALRSLVLSGSIKGGISFFLSLFRVAKGKLSFGKALHVFVDPSTTRFAAMIGSFTFLWKFINNVLYLRAGRLTKRNGAIAGAVAGLSLLFETKENRIGYAQQFFFRSMQAGKNALKHREIWTLPHGDSILFCIATASILYAYCFRPDTIPRGYYSWMKARARVPAPVLQQHCSHVAAIEKHQSQYFDIDLPKYKALLDTTKASPRNRELFFKYLADHDGKMPGFPCSLYHPTSDGCTIHFARLWSKIFTEMLPVYFSLSAIPMLALNPNKLLKNPVAQAKKIGFAVARSSTFLASLVSTFQAGMCLYFNVFPEGKTKNIVYPLGGLSALWIFLEQKSKRVEFALFALPKGLQSLYTVLIDNGRLPNIPHIEVAAGVFATSTLMSLYQLEPEHISGVLLRLMKATL